MDRSLLGILAAFRDDGFTYDFFSRPGGMVECSQCHAAHRADGLELHELMLGGLLAGLATTLLVVPCVYSLLVPNRFDPPDDALPVA